MSLNVKTFELRTQSKTELTQKLVELKDELANLRVQKVASGSANKVSKIRHIRKAIARVNTFITQVDRTAAKAEFAGKKYLPTDLREKKTRAIRRRLTKDEASRKTIRQQRNLIASKPLKYAVKAI